LDRATAEGRPNGRPDGEFFVKIVIMTDVHGNLPALRAALRVIRREGYDVIYHTGDAIGIGPYPAEALDVLLSTPRIVMLMGNHEARFAEGLPQQPPQGMSEMAFEHNHWVHSVLEPALRPVVARWPYCIRASFDGLRVTFIHYGLEGTDWTFAPVVQEPTPADLDRIFGGYTSDLVFYGHHHPASDITGRARYVNPGSLGCFQKPLARFAVLEIAAHGGYTLEKRAVPYDNTDLLQELTRRRVPARDYIYRAFFGVDPADFA